MSNLNTFSTADQVTTITTRKTEWTYDRHGEGGNLADFRVSGQHNLGTSPFQAVMLDVYVQNRKSREEFRLTKADAEALRDMFTDIANMMA